MSRRKTCHECGMKSGYHKMDCSRRAGGIRVLDCGCSMIGVQGPTPYLNVSRDCTGEHAAPAENPHRFIPPWRMECGCVVVNSEVDRMLGCSVDHGDEWATGYPAPRDYTAKHEGQAVNPAENRPTREVVAHYTVGEIECIDYLADKLGYEGVMDFMLGNILKYGSRAKHKGQYRSDLVKIRNYASMAIEKYDKHHAGQ